MSTAEPQVTNHEKQSAIPLSKLPRTLVSRRWWWITLLVIAGMIGLARLGVWQLDRLQQRRAKNVEFLQQMAAPPLTLTGAKLPAEPAELRDRQAEARGSYDFSEQLILVQQNWQGRPGAHMITPLVLEEDGVAVLVNRGWVPAAEIETGDLAKYDEPGEQFVSGSIQLSQVLSGGRETIVNGRQQEWYRVDIEAIQKQMPYGLLPIYLQASPVDDSFEALPYRIKTEIDLSDGPHLGYAIQWFIFSTMLCLGYLYFVKTRS